MRVCLSLVYMVVYCYNLVARVFSIPCKGVIRPVIVLLLLLFTRPGAVPLIGKPYGRLKGIVTGSWWRLLVRDLSRIMA